MLALHTCAIKMPKATAALAGIRYKDWDAEYIGAGFEFSVFRTGHDEVLKIAHGTIDMPRHEQEGYAEQRRNSYQLMARWLGDFALPQSVEVAPLPFLPSRTAVQVRQPYRDIVDPELFHRDNPGINPANVTTVRDAHPSSGSQLLDFIERAQSLYKAQELVPDTNGSGNLIMAGEDFLMVDGQPIGTEHRPVQNIILGQLASLELAIAA
jgi:hypothetical protein